MIAHKVSGRISRERKHSKKRDAILQIIRSTKSHPSAQWVYDQLKPLIPDLSLATVYRNINLFQEEGTVVSVGVVNGEERFDGYVKPHPHFICSRCGRVLDYSCSNIENLKQIVDDPPQGSIDYRKTVFYGLCDHCVDP
jgi:Fur family peroxide stress response transcriptional regulator